MAIESFPKSPNMQQTEIPWGWITFFVLFSLLILSFVINSWKNGFWCKLPWFKNQNWLKCDNCTPTDDEKVTGAATYIKDDNGDCVANTCVSGYNLLPVNNKCIISDDITQVTAGTKCRQGATATQNETEAYCTIEWRNADIAARGQDTVISSNVCTDELYSQCSRTIPSNCDDDDDKTHYYCGATTALARCCSDSTVDKTNCNWKDKTSCTNPKTK